VRGKGEGSIYKDSRGLWTATVELPSSNGKRRRKVIRSKVKSNVLRELTALKHELAQRGDLPTAGQSLASWLEYWERAIAARKLRPKTQANYRMMIRRHIIPAIGSVTLAKLTAAHVRRLHEEMEAKGLSSSTVLYAHRVLASALRSAEREGRMSRNVTQLVDAPRKSVPKLRALTADEGIEVLLNVAQARLGSRWSAALLTGARQGELLGLELDRVTEAEIDLSWQLQRLTWSHGCMTPCGHARAAECPEKRMIAPADHELRHIEGGLWWSRPKSDAGWRVIPLVEPLRSILLHRVEVAQSEPNPHGLVWTSDPKKDKHGRVMPISGAPIDPRFDSEAWHAVLKDALVPDVREHDIRHTTIDLLYAAGVPEVVIIDIVGHVSKEMSRKYRSRGTMLQLGDALSRVAALLTAEEMDVRIDAKELHRHPEFEAHFGNVIRPGEQRSDLILIN
jgi:integrase